MTSIVKTSEECADRLLGLFNQLLGGLPPGTATVGSKRSEHDDGTVVWLKPSNRLAAEFSAHIEDGNPSLIDVSFGSGTTIELPWESKLPSDATFEMVLGEVRELVLAVAAGRCEERLGILGIRGTIRVDAENVYCSTHYFHARLFPRTIHYEPYSPTTTSSADYLRG